MCSTLSNTILENGWAPYKLWCREILIMKNHYLTLFFFPMKTVLCSSFVCFVSLGDWVLVMYPWLAPNLGILLLSASVTPLALGIWFNPYHWNKTNPLKTTEYDEEIHANPKSVDSGREWRGEKDKGKQWRLSPRLAGVACPECRLWEFSQLHPSLTGSEQIWDLFWIFVDLYSCWPRDTVQHPSTQHLHSSNHYQ